MKRPKLTEKRFDKWADELAEWIQESVSPFPDEAKETQADRIARAKSDKLYFMQTYFPHYFTAEFGDFQEEWADLSEIRDEAVFIAAPRGHAKSTIFSFGIPLHDICFQLRHFILLISDTNDQATGFTLPIRIELEENPRLKYDFGEFRGRRWKENDFVTTNGVRVLARGRGQKVRGLKHLQYRPDRAIVDDFENDQNVRNPRLCKEGKEWLSKAVMGSMADGYSMTMVGNIFAPKSILAQYIADEENGKKIFISRIYSAITEKGQPLWQSVWILDRLEKKRRQMGTLNFNAEMLNKVIPEDSPFKESWFCHYEEVPVCHSVVSFLDPSAKSGMSNDYKSIITVGLDRQHMKFYLLHAWIRHTTVNRMIEQCYRTIDQYGGMLGIETNMLEDFLRETFHAAARDRGRYLPIREIRHTTNKEGRIIATLSPLVEFGKLLFREGHSDQELLKEQLIDILDKNVNDDGPDALEGAVSLLQTFGHRIEYESTGNRRRSLSAMDNYING